ncbi:MAG: carboxypeptidase regulatory-like domain-containing protein [Acidobacteria bacterium]|nr:carboxypeptidase regulatory-like domain-containing protein [Acidobacteriota bacterium]
MLLYRSLLFMILALPFSGNTATINGSVVDQSDQPVKKATILLLSESISSVSKVETAGDGNFSFTNIEPGVYTVIVLHYGFVPWARENINVENDQQATLDIALVPADDKNFVIKYMKPRRDDLDSFASALDTLKEPHFCSNTVISQEYESYRFLYLRSFHQPVLIHLKYDTDTASVIIKELEGEDYSKFGSLSEVAEIDLRKRWSQNGTPAELHQNMLDNISKEAQELFWEQPFKIDAGIIGLDGATWTIEGVKNGKCHVVTRWSPEKGTPIRAFADTLIHYSGKRLYYDEVY